MRVSTSMTLGVAAGIMGVMQGGHVDQALAKDIETKKWNYVIILTDDQGYQDLSCYGSPHIKTPNIDRLAAEGMRFTQYYSGASICSPARAALLTGCWPRRLGFTDVLFPSRIGMNTNEFTIAKMVKQAGYVTGAIGKWHLGSVPGLLPKNHGFDSFYGLPYSNDMGSDPTKYEKKDKKESDAARLDEAWRRTKESRFWWHVPLIRDEAVIENPVDQSRLTERYTEEAVSFIEKNKGKPFFLYLAHNMPHVPLFVSDDRYDPDPKKAYQLAVEHIDDSTRRVMEALKKAGVDKNTIVIYASDNGPWLPKGHHGGSAKPLAGGKRSLTEGGIRVPCIMWAPGLISSGKVCDEVVTAMDILPTLAGLTGVAMPTDRVIDGKDILPLMRGVPGAKSPTEAIYYFSGDYIDAIRMGNWKLYKRGGTVETAELVDLTRVGHEKGIVNDKAHADLVKAMLDKMNAFESELRSHIRPLANLDGKGAANETPGKGKKGKTKPVGETKASEEG